MHSVALWPTLIVLAIASISDVRCRRIPNWLVFPFFLAGPVALTATRGWTGFGQSCLGISLAVISLGILYYLGGLGMGDVKLCAAIGAWVGPGQLMLALVIMGIAGGVMAFGWALAGGFLKESVSGAGDLVFGFKKRGFRPHETLVLANPHTKKMPYAPAIAIGTIFSFFAQP